MFRDAGVRRVLAAPGLEGVLPDSAPAVVPLDRAATEVPAASPRATAPPIHPRQAAYVIFTSGSTGEPKGSVIEHVAVAARSLATAKAQGLAPGVRSLCFFPLAWDGSLHEMLPALAAGATVVLHPDPRGDTPQDFLRRCERDRIGSAFCPVGFLHELALDLGGTGGATPPALVHLTTGGDAPRAADVAGILRAARPGLTFTNVYGPTETVIVATAESLTLEGVRSHTRPRTSWTKASGPFRSAPSGRSSWAARCSPAATPDGRTSPPPRSSPIRSPPSPARGCTAPATSRDGWRTDASCSWGGATGRSRSAGSAWSSARWSTRWPRCRAWPSAS
jgi:acyl-CoA synthetase (AMP-forming)/AMP-acid ligase II